VKNDRPGSGLGDGDAVAGGFALAPNLRRIWHEAAANDGMLPSEKELSALLGVGRNTIREALIRLEADGFVARRHGAGTFANLAALDVRVRIDRTAEYADILRDAGVEPTVEVIEHGWEILGAPGSERLRAADGSSVYRTRKRWLADGAPVMLADDLVPARRHVPVDPEASVFQIALLLNGRSTDWVCTSVDAVVAGESAALLGCEPGEPVLCFEQVGVARDGTRCWSAREYHHPRGHPGGLTYGLVRTIRSDSADPERS